jgi:hypothetical protein
MLINSFILMTLTNAAAVHNQCVGNRYAASRTEYAEGNMPDQRYLAGESDIFVGRRVAPALSRLFDGGFFPVLARTGPECLAVVYRTARPCRRQRHAGRRPSDDGGVSWSDPREIAPRWETTATLPWG